MAKRSSLGSMVRRRLSDITSSLPQAKAPVILENPDAAASKEYIDHLVKEKMALMKHIHEKNKIIELTGTEILKMRAYLQKMQLQNWSLAQSNSHMLAELNSGKERLKALQHELACKESLLKTKNLELEEQENVNTREKEFVIAEESELVAAESGHHDNSKRFNASRRGHQSRRRSLGDATVSQVHAEKESPKTKRHCLRRQSTSSIIEPKDSSESLFEIENLALNSATQNLAKIEGSDGNCGSNFEHGDSRRLSCIGRPMRRAAGKVQSYKEKPLNVKMRRSE